MTVSPRVVSVLRRDVAFVWHVAIAAVFISFAGVAVGAALVDLIAVSQ